MENFQKSGHILSVLGVAIVLIWIGIFKFTPTEARAIRPLVEHSPLMSWLYRYATEMTVSRMIGIIEIITGTALILSLWFDAVGLIAGIFSAVTFILTISFLFTTPDAFQRIDGIWVPDAFILKDVMALGISLSVIGRSLTKL